MNRCFLVLLAVLTIGVPCSAQSPTSRRAAAEVLKDVKAPAGFEMNLFAQPPEVVEKPATGPKPG